MSFVLYIFVLEIVRLALCGLFALNLGCVKCLEIIGVTELIKRRLTFSVKKLAEGKLRQGWGWDDEQNLAAAHG